jgi:hypothetical protein
MKYMDKRNDGFGTKMITEDEGADAAGLTSRYIH